MLDRGLEILCTLFFNKESVSVAVTNWAAVGFLTLLLACAWTLKDINGGGPHRTLNLLVAGLGLLVGWALSLFWIPMDDTEKAAFGQIGTAVSAFAGGYVLSTFGKVVESVLVRDAKPYVPNVRRAGLFLSALALAAVVVITNRIVWVANEASKQDQLTKLFKGYQLDYVRAVAAAQAASAGMSAASAARGANPVAAEVQKPGCVASSAGCR